MSPFVIEALSAPVRRNEFLLTVSMTSRPKYDLTPVTSFTKIVKVTLIGRVYNNFLGGFLVTVGGYKTSRNGDG